MQLNNYALNHNEAFNLICATGQRVTYCLRGPIGSGKTALRDMFTERNAKTASGLEYQAHIYFDCNTKDVGDVSVPMVTQITESEGGVHIVRSALHEELGLHFDGPITVCIDEIGKALPPVRNQLTRLCNERKLGNGVMHPESIVFATTNLAGENVGDSFLDHQLDRINFIPFRKPNNIEWITWGINHNINDHVLGFAKDKPELFQTFTDVKDPDDNPYIHHPQAVNREAFWTPRSGARGAFIVDQRNLITDRELQAALAGEWGAPAAADFMASLHLRDKMPSMDEIADNPTTCPIPDNDAACCSVIYRSLRNMSREFIDPWMTYLKRMPHGMQALFVSSAADMDYKHNTIVVQNGQYGVWAAANRHVFASDTDRSVR